MGGSAPDDARRASNIEAAKRPAPERDLPAAVAGGFFDGDFADACSTMPEDGERE